MSIIRRYARAVIAKARQHQLVSGVLAVVAVTFLFTAISMSLYVTSGASGLDLSRPGFSAARTDLEAETTPVFSASGNLTQSDIDAFVKQYNDQRARLNKIGAFDDQSLSDQSLGLELPETPQTSGQ